MIRDAARIASEPYVPTINVPVRRVHDDAHEMRPHRRTGFKLTGVNDED